MQWRYEWHGSGSDENGDALRKGAHIYFGREHVAWFGEHHQQASDLVRLLNERQAPEQDGERWEQVNLDDLGRWGDDLRDSDTNLLFLPQAIDIAIAEITNLRREVAKLRGTLAACCGWKLVPVESTAEMDKAGETALYAEGDCDCGNPRIRDPEQVYLAMLAAAPEAPKS